MDWADWEARFPCESCSARDVRRFLGAVLGDLPSEVLASVLLMASELVNNAMEYGQADHCEVRVRRGRPTGPVRIEARDASSRAPEVRDGDPMRPRGRGLRIVQDLADRGGWKPTPTGKVTWFEVELA